MASRHRARVVDFGEQKIIAIKLVRELTAAGLREAKDLVEQHLEFEFELDQRKQAVLDQARSQRIVIELDGQRSEISIARGTGCAVRYVSGPNKIAAIRLVRELRNELGLVDAKTLVEDCGVVQTGLTRAEAEVILSQFAAIESRVEIIGGGQRSSLASDMQATARSDEDTDDF
jgi:ribosomal protein L7/L12